MGNSRRGLRISAEVYDERSGRPEALPRPLDGVEIVARTGARQHGPSPVAAFRTLRTDDRANRGDLFVAIRGVHYDSHRSISELPRSGVLGVVAESAPPAGYPLPWFEVDDTRRALGRLEHARWGDPAQRLRVFGITGTNGKSSTVRILASIFEAAESSCGFMTTVSRSLAGTEEPSAMTTPGASDLAEMLARCVAYGSRSVVLEVSSHALDQHRVEGIPFAGAAITQLSRDHLDYHGDLRAYRDAKLRITEHLADGAPIVLPTDETFRSDLPDLPGVLLRHSMNAELLAGERGGTVRGSELDGEGISAELELLGERLLIRSTLRGRHNLENILTASTLARAVGISMEVIASGIERTPAVPGRLEEVKGKVGRGRVFIDYAHTPDALSAVLESLRAWRPRRLLVVFGCGGDRDRGKRPEMGAAAERLADRVFVTSDNPRGEDPGAIIDDVLRGIEDRGRVVVEPDRRSAIAAAVADLGGEDLLVVAGKGHEREQWIGGTNIPFDDRQVVAELLAAEPRS